MKHSIITSICIFLITTAINAQTKYDNIQGFNKVVTGPHVELILTQGDEESVKIEADQPLERLVRVKKVGKTLRIFLDNARLYNKYESGSRNWKKRSKYDLYGDVRVTAKVTYRQLKGIQARGSEYVQVKGNLTGDRFKTKLYGSCDLRVEDVNVDKFKMKMYGDNKVRIGSGNVGKQLVRVYGSNYVNTKKLKSDVVKSTSFGSNELLLYSNTKLKYSAFGDLTLDDFGKGYHRRGIVLGSSDVY